MSNIDFNKTCIVDKKYPQNFTKDSESKLRGINHSAKSNAELSITPKYNIIHRGFFDMQDFTNTMQVDYFCDFKKFNDDFFFFNVMFLHNCFNIIFTIQFFLML